MELDAKNKVLFALYAEYQRDLPEIPGITEDTLSMDNRVFKIALMKLQNEGFIDGLQVFPAGTRMEPKAVMLDSVMLTRFGIEYVEEKLEIKKMASGPEKLKYLIAKFGKFGWEVLQGVAVEVLSR